MTTSPNTPKLSDIASDAAQTVPRPAPHIFARFVLPISILVVAALLLGATAWRAFAPARSVRTVSAAVRAVETTAADITRTPGAVIQAPGWVEPDPFPIYVAALTNGIIEAVSVLEGDVIEADQAIAQLINDDARLAVMRAQAALALEQASTERVRAELNAATVNLRELVGPTRRAAVAKATFAQRQAAAAAFASKLLTARAEHAQLLDEYDRKLPLVEEGAVAEAVVVRLKFQIEASDAATQSIEEAQRAAEAVAQSALAEHHAATRDLALLVEETLDVDRAKANLAHSTAAVALAQAELDNALLQFERCTVRSPVAGIVMERLAAPGSIINQNNGNHGAHILHLYDPAHLQVRADIPLADASRVGVGQRAEIVVDMLPDTVFQGRVTRFVHKANIQKNTVEAKVQIEDPSPLLKPEMLARVRILADLSDGTPNGTTTVQRVFVPESALAEHNGIRGVWIADGLDRGRGVATFRSLELGTTTNNQWIEVIDGVRPGERIILENEGLQNGARVALTHMKEA